MRITGGVWRSRRLVGPRGNWLRPTSDAVREAFFSHLGELVSYGPFMDLFCGTGAVGFDAMSRGAPFVFFVDSDPRARKLVMENASRLGASKDSWRFVPAEAGRAVELLRRWGRRFAVCWADPPYEIWEEGLSLLGKVWGLGLVEPWGRLALEAPARWVRGSLRLPAGLVLARVLGRGDTKVLVFKGAQIGDG